MNIFRRLLLVVLVIAVLGAIGVLICGYTLWPFTLFGLSAGAISYALVIRDGLRSPVPTRSDLDD